jgi:copper chaperone
VNEDGEQRRFSVAGMTCEHCVAAVGAEVGALRGVSGVDIDLASGAVVVSGSGLDDEAIRLAVEEAGYSFIS